MSRIGRTLAGLAIAPLLWSFVFRSKRANFWSRMTLATGALGAFAVSQRPQILRERLRAEDLATGIGSAALLYLVFQLGDRLSRVVMPSGEEEIQDIYRLRTLAPRPVIALLLAAIIGPGEELFWRGLVQEALIERLGKARGTALGAAAYGGTHLVTGNLTLTGAATVAGGFWGAQYALQRRLAPLLVSHILWDLWIFLVAPTPTGRRSSQA